MSRRPWRFPAGLFALTLALLLTWTVATPLFASPDEPSHLYKAYGTAHGQTIGERVTDDLPNLRRFDVPDEMGQSPGIMCWIFQPDSSVACETPGAVGAGESTAAVYPPFWYAVVGGGARLLGHDTSQRTYRAVGALLCAALVAAAFAVADRSRARRLMPLLLLGLTPMTLFLSGTVNPNGFEIAGFLLLWSLCLLAWHDRAAGRLGGAVVGAIVAALLLSRVASVMWVLAGAAVMSIVLGWAGVRRFVNLRFLVPALGLSGAAAVFLFGWLQYADAETVDPRLATDAGAADVARASWERTPEYLRQMIGILGWLDTRLPWFVYALFAVITAVALAGVIASRDRRLITAAAAVCLGTILVPIVINVLIARSAGIFWQGRYTLPLFTMLALLGMLGWQRTIDRHPSSPAPAVVGVVVAVCFVVAEVASFWQMLRRFAVGADGKVWLAEPLPWRPSIAPLPLIALNALLVAGLAAAVVWRAQAGAPWAAGAGPDPLPAAVPHTAEQGADADPLDDAQGHTTHSRSGGRSGDSTAG